MPARHASEAADGRTAAGTGTGPEHGRERTTKPETMPTAARARADYLDALQAEARGILERFRRDALEPAK